MRLDTKALGLTFGLLAGGAILIVGIANLIWTDYGLAILELIASGYPGYNGSGSFGQVIIATLYGVLDGFIGGVIVGWVYNHLVSVPTTITSG